MSKYKIKIIEKTVYFVILDCDDIDSVECEAQDMFFENRGDYLEFASTEEGGIETEIAEIDGVEYKG